MRIGMLGEFNGGIAPAGETLGRPMMIRPPTRQGW
jgi:hypothetical protein